VNWMQIHDSRFDSSQRRFIERTTNVQIERRQRNTVINTTNAVNYDEFDFMFAKSNKQFAVILTHRSAPLRGYSSRSPTFVDAHLAAARASMKAHAPAKTYRLLIHKGPATHVPHPEDKRNRVQVQQ
jgi:hypothetical protein